MNDMNGLVCVESAFCAFNPSHRTDSALSDFSTDSLDDSVEIRMKEFLQVGGVGSGMMAVVAVTVVMVVAVVGGLWFVVGGCGEYGDGCGNSDCGTLDTASSFV